MNRPKQSERQSGFVLRCEPSSRSFAFPFTALVGLDLARRALLLLAVEPKLKGALIAAGPGTAKSTLARSYPFIFPPHNDPHQHQSAISHQRMLYVELPLGATEDRVLGGLDLELTLTTGMRQLKLGLLAEAHGGILYIDGINLLETSIANHVSSALSEGQVVLEREGLSRVCATDFMLIGTYDPAEGEVNAALRDRVGLLVTEGPSSSADERAEIARRVADYSLDPVGFTQEYANATALQQKRIAAARDRLPAVQATMQEQQCLALAALRLGVEGNRADIFALRAARANAALAGRDRIEAEDIETAIQLVLAPRALFIPTPEEEQSAQPQATPEHQPASDSGTEDQTSELPNTQHPTPNTQLILQALDAHLPPGLLATSRRIERRSVIGSRGETFNRVRGRYVKSVTGRPGDGKIAVDATLRAAAPLQALRRPERSQQGITIEVADLRFKRFKQKAGMLFIFAVDGSGSMALNRMGQAKGALARLLKEAYLHRDKVALISFRGRQAEVLLPPSQSVERAKRSLDALPVGGGTPLAAGLLAALDLAKRTRRSGIRQTMLVLFTDGRANVGLKAHGTDVAARRQIIRQELEQVGAALQREAVASLIVDTQAHFTSRGEGRSLAEMLGGRYVHLPQANTTEVYETVAATAIQMRS